MTYLGLVSRFSDFWSVVLSIPKTCFSTFTFICILLKKIYTPDKLGLEILTLGRDDSLQAGGNEVLSSGVFDPPKRRLCNDLSNLTVFRLTSFKPSGCGKDQLLEC